MWPWHELQQLRARLEAAEIDEARQAARVMVMANTAHQIWAAQRIQAGFHGMVARVWCASLRMERRERAAVVVQAGFSGYYARAQARHRREATMRRDNAARVIQAGPEWSAGPSHHAAAAAAATARSGSDMMAHIYCQAACNLPFLRSRLEADVASVRAQLSHESACSLWLSVRPGRRPPGGSHDNKRSAANDTFNCYNSTMLLYMYSM